MKINEELNAIKVEIESINKKLNEPKEVADGQAEAFIRVRGGGSITQSNEPLFIVDGMVTGNRNE